jgi:hypothetical protein
MFVSATKKFAEITTIRQRRGSDQSTERGKKMASKNVSKTCMNLGKNVGILTGTILKEILCALMWDCLFLCNKPIP